MNKETLAALLNGRQYRDEITSEEINQANEAGLVVVFGASDDLLILSGAMDDEIGVRDRDSVRISSHAEVVKKGGKGIQVFWDDHSTGASWVYESDIPHAKFEIREDDGLYCIGIVFSIEDLKPKQKTKKEITEDQRKNLNVQFKRLSSLLADDDLTDDDLREASESLLPNLHDAIIPFLNG